VALGLDGIVATNTTISRQGLSSSPQQVEAAGGGGLSGPPLRSRATEVIRLLRDRVGPDLTLIGVGGITTADDMVERLAAGADLLQAYTGFVYEGPWWPARMNTRLSRRLVQEPSTTDRATRPTTIPGTGAGPGSGTGPGTGTATGEQP
jgi:dihydroorotate dehydrogenase